MHALQAASFARSWTDAWNAHDLEAVLAHFSDDVVFRSAIAVRILGGDGVVSGKDALREYWAAGLRLTPGLRFELLDVYPGVDVLVINYRDQAGVLHDEVLIFEGSKVVAGYGTHRVDA